MNKKLFDLLSWGMAISPFVALVLAVSFYRHYREAPEPKGYVSLFKYIVVLFVLSIIAWVAGTIFGAAKLCSPGAGGMCAMVFGAFGLGPLFSAITDILVAWVWTRNAL